MAEVRSVLGRCGETVLSFASTSGRLLPSASQKVPNCAPLPTNSSRQHVNQHVCRARSCGHFSGEAKGNFSWQMQRVLNTKALLGPPRMSRRQGLCQKQRAGILGSTATPGGTNSFQPEFAMPPLVQRRSFGCRAAVVPMESDEDDFEFEAPQAKTSTAVVTSVEPPLWRKAADVVRRVLDLNEWVLRDFRQIVTGVRAWESHMASLSDVQLKAQTAKFRRQLAAGATLEDIQAEAFATVREAAGRTLGMRHFDVQVLGGAVLHGGAVAEMRTGEGKTLVATLPAYLNALEGKGVHVITVNDYLAKRDAEWVGRVHRFLGLSVGLIQSEMYPPERRAAYACDITYAHNNEVGFDYLRDMVEMNPSQTRHRTKDPFHYAILDEVDSVLIDEGRNPLIISGPSGVRIDKYPRAAAVANQMVRDRDYKVKEASKSVELLEEGVLGAEVALGVPDLWAEDDTWADFLVTALKAKECYKRDKDYIVKDGQVIIVDEFTGRSQPGRRYGDHVHQAVEAKEDVPIQEEMVTIAEITHQAFFRLYAKLSGMTGTAKTEEEEFVRVFKLPVVVVPTNRPAIRVDLPLEVYRNARGKFAAVAREVLAMTRLGRPVLVGTTSVSTSEHLSDLLRDSLISHNLLNARPQYAALEAEIIAQAGRFGAITISTNMAGRGTDILLGGNSEMLAGTMLRKYLLPLLCPPGQPTEDGSGAEEESAETPVTQVLPPVRCSPATIAMVANAQRAARAVAPLDAESAAGLLARASDLGLERSLQPHWERRLAAPQDVFTPTNVLPADLTGSPEETLLLFWMAAAYFALHKDCSVHCKHEGQEVRRLGGLHVIGTELHESRRVDNQLKGRAGRQGDPGSSQFMVALDDALALHFRSVFEPTKNAMSLIYSEYENLDGGNGIFARQFRKFQMQKEKQHLRDRKANIDYDDVPEVQRAYVYKLRQKMVQAPYAAVEQCMFQYMQECVDDAIRKHASAKQSPTKWNLAAILEEVQQLGDVHLNDVAPFSLPPPAALLAELQALPSPPSTALSLPPGLPLRDLGIQEMRGVIARQAQRGEQRNPEWCGKYRDAIQALRSFLAESLIARYRRMTNLSANPPVIRDYSTTLLLVAEIDVNWKHHLANLKRLRSAVSVRGFGQMNPLEEFRIEGCRLFLGMLEDMRRNMVQIMVLSPRMRSYKFDDYDLRMPEDMDFEFKN